MRKPLNFSAIREKIILYKTKDRRNIRARLFQPQPPKGTNMKTKTAAKAAKKAAPAKGGKPESEAAKKARAARDKARREAAKAAKETPAKKAAKPAAKTVAKVPAKKPVKVANAKNTKPAAVAKATRPNGEAKPAPKVVTGHKAGTLPGDETRNGVLRPREGTQARTLWDVCDKLQDNLGRPPARFEFRQAIFGKEYNPDSASFQYFAWRKFHGVKGRSIGIYPKRNSFEANTPAPSAPAKKAAKTAAKVPAKKAPAKAAKPAVKASKPKAAPKGKVSIDTPAPKVSSRAAKAAEAAKSETPEAVAV